MFTGIVEEAGVVEEITESPSGIGLRIRTRVCGPDLKVGDSLAVNGCCLTVTKVTGRGRAKSVYFDLLRETWHRTNLQFVSPGSAVNLERPLRADARLGGHFVTGHIDGLGRIQRWKRQGADWVLDVSAPWEILKYVVEKGSIALDGISLTIAAVEKKTFRIWIIPHTFRVTAIHERHVGDAVNLEADILGKYVERFIHARARRPKLEENR